jgi:hypothetical protein
MLSNRAYTHIRSNAIAYAALFFAITGSAAAMSKFKGEIRNKNITTGAVDSRTIQNHGIRGKDLHRSSVGSAAVASGSLRGGDLGGNTITGAQIDERTLDPDVLQLRVSSACPPGAAIRGIGPDGEVTCESTTGTTTVEGITNLTTSGGLTGGGNSGTVNVGVDPTQIQSRVGGTCLPGFAIRSVKQDGTISCEVTGSVTSVDSGFGLIGGPITDAGTIAANPAVLQRRVEGFCTANTAIRGIGEAGDVGCSSFVARVSAGAGLTGGVITNAGTIAADTTFLQRRVKGSCTGNQAIQSVNETGTVACSGGFVAAGRVLVPQAMRVDPGSSVSLLFANGIRLVGDCSPALSADVKVLSTTGGQVNAYGKSQSLGFVKASTTTFAKLGSSANGDRGDFNSFSDSSGQTLDGSFMSFHAGGQCVFEASGTAS